MFSSSDSKRHIIIDVLGILIGIIVHVAAIKDRDGAKLFISIKSSF